MHFTLLVFSQECDVCKFTKKRNFHFKRESIQIDTSLVRTDGVYIFEGTNANLNNGNSYYYYYRFFNNGKVYMSCKYCSLPDSTEINNLNFGLGGYYKVTSDTLTLEMYSFMGGYHYKYYQINGNQLIFVGGKRRKEKIIEKVPRLIYIYSKGKIDNAVKPSW
jgi:hypothetical protein